MLGFRDAGMLGFGEFGNAGIGGCWDWGFLYLRKNECLLCGYSGYICSFR